MSSHATSVVHAYYLFVCRLPRLVVCIHEIKIYLVSRLTENSAPHGIEIDEKKKNKKIARHIIIEINSLF